MVDAADGSTERHWHISPERCHSAAVALQDAPIRAADAIAGTVVNRNPVELGAAHIGADRIEEAVPRLLRR
jgi:hypothetical protein